MSKNKNTPSSLKNWLNIYSACHLPRKIKKKSKRQAINAYTVSSEVKELIDIVYGIDRPLNQSELDRIETLRPITRKYLLFK